MDNLRFTFVIIVNIFSFFILLANSTNAAAAVAQAAIMAQQKKQSIIHGSPTLTAPAMLRNTAMVMSTTPEYTVYRKSMLVISLTKTPKLILLLAMIAIKL